MMKIGLSNVIKYQSNIITRLIKSDVMRGDMMRGDVR